MCACALGLIVATATVGRVSAEPPAEPAAAASPASQQAAPAPEAHPAPDQPARKPDEPAAAERADQPPAAERADQTPSDTVALLPRDLTPWGMFLNADIVVKVVMVGLALASLVTWTIALAKGMEVAFARRRLRRALRTFGSVASLADAGRRLGAPGPLAGVLGAALDELRRSSELADKSGVKERLALRLERLEAEAGRRMTRGTGLLATIGATAPFIGLFGTVWGIMNSFIGISRLHTTNLAVVAPGIAEALLATALGLAAAIPAVVIYNMFSRAIAAYRALLADATAETLRMTSRDLDRAAASPGASLMRPAAE